MLGQQQVTNQQKVTSGHNVHPSQPFRSSLPARGRTLARSLKSQDLHGVARVKSLQFYRIVAPVESIPDLVLAAMCCYWSPRPKTEAIYCTYHDVLSRP